MICKLQALLNLSVDPFVGVAEIAKKIVNGITLKVCVPVQLRTMKT